MLTVKNRVAYWVCGLVFVTATSHAEGLTDPTQPPKSSSPGGAVSSAIDPGRWSLESTLVGPGRRVAVINGKSVTVGDHIDGAEIISIRQHDVLLMTPLRKLTLRLLPDIIKAQP